MIIFFNDVQWGAAVGGDNIYNLFAYFWNPQASKLENNQNVLVRFFAHATVTTTCMLVGSH